MTHPPDDTLADAVALDVLIAGLGQVFLMAQTALADREASLLQALAASPQAPWAELLGVRQHHLAAMTVECRGDLRDVMTPQGYRRGLVMRDTGEHCLRLEFVREPASVITELDGQRLGTAPVTPDHTEARIPRVRVIVLPGELARE